RSIFFSPSTVAESQHGRTTSRPTVSRSPSGASSDAGRCADTVDVAAGRGGGETTVCGCGGAARCAAAGVCVATRGGAVGAGFRGVGPNECAAEDAAGPTREIVALERLERADRDLRSRGNLAQRHAAALPRRAQPAAEIARCSV